MTLPAMSQPVLALSDRVVVLDQHAVFGPGEATAALTQLEVDLLAFLAGRPGEAVDRDELLREVWGYAATVESRAVDKIVFRLRGKLEVDAAAPRHLQGVRGLGYRLVGVTEQRRDAAVTNLAAPLAPAFGQDALLARLVAALQPAGAVVAVVGPPGAGKSRLVATAALRHHAGGGTAVRVDLRGVTDAHAVAEALCDALDVPWSATIERVPALQRALGRGASPLLLLDGVESCAGTLPPLIAGLGGVARWLLASRVDLPDVGARHLRVGPLGALDGVALLRDRAARAGVDEARLEGEDDVLAALVDAVGGHPQTLEILATGLGLQRADELLARARGAVARGAAEARWTQALRYAVEGQWAGLAGDHAVHLARCAAFDGPFALAEAADVVAADVEALAEAVEAGARAAILRTLDDDGVTRFVFSPPARVFGLARMDAAGERAAVADRLAEHVLADAEAAAREVGRAHPRGFPALERLRPALLELAADAGRSARAVRAVLPLQLVQARRQPVRCVALLDALLATPEGQARGAELEVARASALRRLDRHVEARAAAERAVLALAEGWAPPGRDARVLEAEARLELSATAAHAGRSATEGIEEAKRALALVVDLDEPRLQAHLRAQLGRLLAFRGHFEDAGAHFAFASDVFRAGGDVELHAFAVHRLAHAALSLGRHHETLRIADEARLPFHRPEAAAQVGWIHFTLAVALLDLGRLAEARQRLEEAREMAHQLENPLQLALVHEVLGIVATERGQLEDARFHLDVMRERAARLGGVLLLRAAASHRGFVDHLEGRLDDAERGYAQVLSLADDEVPVLHLRWVVALSLLLAAERGDFGTYESLAGRLEVLLEKSGNPSLFREARRLAGALAGDRPGAVAVAEAVAAAMPVDQGHEARLLAKLARRVGERVAAEV